MRIKAGGNIGTASGRAKLKQQREPYWVAITRGCSLGYRKGKKGGAWIARWTTEDGGYTFEALGPADDLNDGNGDTYEAALAEARKHFGLSKARGKHTVGDALDNYLKHMRATNPDSTVHDAEKRINAILKPALGQIALSKLRPAQITRWRDDAAKTRKPDTVNRIFAILKAALNYAWKEDRIIAEDSAWRMVGKLKGGGAARKVFLTAAQSRLLVSHCKPEAFRRLVQAALLTGARFGELVPLTVQDFDAATGTLEIGSGKTGARTVYLSDEAVAFFSSITAGRPARALLLPREDGKQWGKNHHQKPFAAAVAAAELDPDTVFYSLRHTFISMALLAKVNIQIIAENTGTSVRMIEKFYGKFLREDRRKQFNQMPGLLPDESTTPENVR